MTENRTGSGSTKTIQSKGAMGALLGLFVVASVEFQRLWPTGTSAIYLVVALPLLLLWIAHQSGWKVPERIAGLAVDISIYVLVIASIGIRLRSGQTSSELASTLLFWAPLVSAWWAWRYQNLPLRLWLLLGAFFVMLTWQFASVHERLDEHLILSLFIALFVRYALHADPPSAETCMPLRDSLTGLASPECLEAELAHVSAISDRYRLPLSLIGCRVAPDGSSPILDEHLCQCANLIADRTRSSDTSCQWDRNTFVILLPNTPGDMAGKLAREIRESFEHFNFGQNFRLTVTIAAVQHEPGEDPMSTVSTLENKLANSETQCPI
ncbi:MAG: diguanylate cyclase [Proteobacteria bacterium]|nr:diguanylate cyclase [Pseudomonadota bacterium]